MSNSISFLGRLGKDSERKSTNSGQMLKFTVGESVGWGDKKTTNWWNCTIFGKQAEGNLMDYLTKGAQVYITGEVTFSEYEGKTYNNLTVRNIELASNKQQNQSAQPQQNQGGYAKTNNHNQNNDLDDDLPF